MPKKIDYDLPKLNGIETTGQRIAKLRKKQGMSQQTLADKIGINRYLVSDYEIGRARIYDEMVKRFAIALDVSTDYLLGLKDKPEPLSKK